MPKADARTVTKLLREYAQRTTLRGDNPYRAKAYSRRTAWPLSRSRWTSSSCKSGSQRFPASRTRSRTSSRSSIRPAPTRASKSCARNSLQACSNSSTFPGCGRKRFCGSTRIWESPQSLAELEAAAKQDRVKKSKGLGAALQTKILQNLTIAKSGEGSLHLHRAAALLDHAKDSLRTARPELKHLTVAGDLRRGCELVRDLAIVAEKPGTGDHDIGSGSLQVHLPGAKAREVATAQAAVIIHFTDSPTVIDPEIQRDADELRSVSREAGDPARLRRGLSCDGGQRLVAIAAQRAWLGISRELEA
jgi:DNA polymerase (family 10)